MLTSIEDVITPTVALHPYQEHAVDFLQTRPRAALFLDLGLGKTAITLAALTEEHLPVLVVAPKRVCEYVWPIEQTLWRPDLSLVLATGSAKQRYDALRAKADITVISRDNMADALDVEPRRTLVLDELSSFKDRSTRRWKIAKQLAAKALYVWGLTGTPTPNGLLDLWAQVYLLDSGTRLGKNITAYRGRYFRPGRQLPNGTIIEWHLREFAEERIHDLVSDICLSQAAGDYLDLPPVTYNTLVVDVPPVVRQQYKRFKRELVLNLELLGGDIHSAANAAVLTNRLSQLTAGFLYSDDADGRYDMLHHAKLDALSEVVEGTGSPVLVYLRYRAEAELIRARWPHVRGIDEPGAIDDWNAGLVGMLLAHPASAGHGLNLQHGGHTIVWTTLDWSLELWQQANGRLARQGQQHPVVIHTLEVPDTVDGVIADRLVCKEFTQDKLLNHLKAAT